MSTDLAFHWNEWNVEQATKQGCTLPEIESVVRNAGRGYPRYVGNGKWLVYGRGTSGRMTEDIFVLDADHTIYVIHAMPVTLRRRRGAR